MPELRKDPVTRRWVIIARERNLGPADYPAEPDPVRPASDCPFCPGGELAAEKEIMAVRETGAPAAGPDWQLRVVPNKFPALGIEGELVKSGAGMYDRMSGIGAHEVIVETPRHDVSLATMTQLEAERMLGAYRERTVDLRRDSRFKYVLVFKNSGRAAGASQQHSHSQLIATPVVPKRVLEELAGAEAYYKYKERCVWCDILRQELATRERVCAEGEHFIAFAPFASRFPFEVTLIPRAHQSDYGQISDGQIVDLARVLRTVCSSLRDALSDPPYNYMLHTAPFEGSTHDSFHWHIELMPRLTRVAGFEWGSGFYINPTTPESAARWLREAAGVRSPESVESRPLPGVECPS